MNSPFPSDHIVTGSLCYIIRHGRVLLLKRRRPPHIGLWTPPGGKMTMGESPQECAIREVLEETGLTISQPVLRAVLTVVDTAWPVHWLLFVFRASDSEGDGIAADTPEGELRWIDLDALGEYARPLADRESFPSVITDGAIFQGKYVYDKPQNLTSKILYS
jgi:8-oxo-dGTP diphosphatase